LPSRFPSCFLEDWFDGTPGKRELREPPEHGDGMPGSQLKSHLGLRIRPLKVTQSIDWVGKFSSSGQQSVMILTRDLKIG
jgi:hypothetical protein